MKNLRQDTGDSLRSEYKRSDFDKITEGRYARTQIEFAEIVRILIACIGEDNNITFAHHSSGNYLAGHRHGDWTYELDNANQITLRYWLGEFENIEERLLNPPALMSSQQKIELQTLLVTHLERLRTRVDNL